MKRYVLRTRKENGDLIANHYVHSNKLKVAEYAEKTGIKGTIEIVEL